VAAHAYAADPDAAYASLNYPDRYLPDTTHPRMVDAANNEPAKAKRTILWPIVSAELSFMGPWLKQSRVSAAEEQIACDYTLNAGWPQWPGPASPPVLSGYQYFLSTELIPRNR
jgi:hypothetical protein